MDKKNDLFNQPIYNNVYLEFLNARSGIGSVFAFSQLMLI